jgi:Ribonuclease G/E
VAESFINNLNYDLPAPQRKPRVQKYTGGTNSRAVIEARCQRLYSKQLEGKTTRQLVIEHSQNIFKLPTPHIQEKNFSTLPLYI